MIEFSFDNQYIKLGKNFSVPTTPEPVSNPKLIKFNYALASELGIKVDSTDERDLSQVFAGNRLPDDAYPIAMAYAGHQFGNFVPQLGDGRAILIGEVRGSDGVYYGVHFKGSGPTCFSRNGDGRAALGPVIREYLVSEAMANLQVPTTRALAAVSTGDTVARDRLLPGGVITRVAASFVRVGTFEYFAARQDSSSVKILADHIIEQQYPMRGEIENPYHTLLQAVVDRQARLIAKWMQLGFIHGVMNTDNMSIAGETIDYGPCAFMDAYSHDKVFSSIDRWGRYAYKNQPSIGLWNLTRFAESLLPLLSSDIDDAVDIAKNILNSYIKTYESSWLSGMRDKCGLTPNGAADDEDKTLIEDLLNTMDSISVDFTLVFYYLTKIVCDGPSMVDPCRSLFNNSPDFDRWLSRWQDRINKDSSSEDERKTRMRQNNPVYIPRNHQIESAIRAAEDENDFSQFHALHEVLQQPYFERDGLEQFILPPTKEEIVQKTFCGT